MKKHNFAVGDRCFAYSGNKKAAGTVLPWKSACNNLIRLKLDPDSDGIIHDVIFHNKQLRKIKPKEKSVRVTKRKLAEAWDKCVERSSCLNGNKFSMVFMSVCKELGLE